MTILGSEGEERVLMGNEAIARGVLEADARIITGYPGTPSSEVIMTLMSLASRLGIYVEWAVNERVAFEIAFGAALAGVRAMATMKAPGLNVATDPIFSSAYSGVNGGLVVLVADDPGPHTTQTEQDSRWYGPLIKLPIIEPSSPQEAKDFTVMAFELSEKYSLPFILRTTTRVNHSSANVVLGPIRKRHYSIKYVREPERFIRASMEWNRRRHKWLNEVLAKVEEDLDHDERLFSIEGRGEKLIVTAGVCYLHVKQVLENNFRDWGSSFTLVKLGLIYPFPKRPLKSLLSRKKFREVIVVEELDPYIEKEIKILLGDLSISLPVIGKLNGFFPLEGEYSPEVIERVLLGKGKSFEETVQAPRRPPPMCPGCPHRATYLALLQALRLERYRKEDVPIVGDIGCYALSVQPPLEAIWNEHSMGASISIAMGLKAAGIEKPVIATIGDSTLYHSGITSLIEAAHKNVDMLVVVLDNETVAMTGHQETPAYAMTLTGRRTTPIPIEGLIEGLKIKWVKVVDPYNFEEAVRVFREALKQKGLRVVISRHKCVILAKEFRGEVQVDYSLCTNCLTCIRATGCPAFAYSDNRVVIQEDLCNGCGLCTYFCPHKALRVVS